MVSDFGVSEREFYDTFASLDECLLAAFEEGLSRVSRILLDAAECEKGWLERVRAALTALLVFFDEERGWARLLIGDPPSATRSISERRQRALDVLARALMRETHADATSSGWFVPSSELTGELIVAGVFSVIRARILAGAGESLAALAPGLMAFIALPYRASAEGLAPGRMGGGDDEKFTSRHLPVRATYRTTRVLSAIGASPRLNNREIAEAAGLSDEGQTSKLLRRLEQRGLVENFGIGQRCGGPNAWSLTAYGERVLEATRHSLVPGAGAIVGRRVRGAR